MMGMKKGMPAPVDHGLGEFPGEIVVFPEGSPLPLGGTEFFQVDPERHHVKGPSLVMKQGVAEENRAEMTPTSGQKSIQLFGRAMRGDKAFPERVMWA
jgi:hypothetical protein